MTRGQCTKSDLLGLLFFSRSFVFYFLLFFWYVLFAQVMMNDEEQKEAKGQRLFFRRFSRSSVE